MTEPTSVQNVEGLAEPEGTDDVDRIDDLTTSWESSPLTDPLGAQDPAARPLAEHGDTQSSDEPAERRPDF